MTPTPYGPVTDAAGRALDQVRLVGLEARGYHGVFDLEKKDGQTFQADVVLHVDNRAAARSDDLADALDYSVLAEQVVSVLTGAPADLIETVAERIAAVALASPAVFAVDVAVHKPHAPILLAFQDIVVTVRRDRHNPPVVPADAHLAQRAEPVVDEGPVEIPGLEPLSGSGEFPVHGVVPVTTPGLDAALAGPSAVATPVWAPITTVEDDAPLPPSPSPEPEPEPEPDEPEDAGLEPDHLDDRPAEAAEVVLALGSNLGNSQEVLRSAVSALAAVPGLEVHDVSPLARTVAVGGPAGQPDFLNAVVLARTTLAPRELLHVVQGIEIDHGRTRDERWGPRTLDIDLIQFGAVLGFSDDLELPHPRAHERAFVLQPWAEVDPGAVLAGLGGGPVEALAATAPDRDGLRWMALDWLAGPPREA